MKHFLALSLILSSCVSVPPYKGKLRQGDSRVEAAIAEDEKDDISCKDEAFNYQICQSIDDFVDEFSVRFKCQKWESGTELIKVEELEFPEEVKKKLKEKLGDNYRRATTSQSD